LITEALINILYTKVFNLQSSHETLTLDSYLDVCPSQILTHIWVSVLPRSWLIFGCLSFPDLDSYLDVCPSQILTHIWVSVLPRSWLIFGCLSFPDLDSYLGVCPSQIYAVHNSVCLVYSIYLKVSELISKFPAVFSLKLCGLDFLK